MAEMNREWGFFRTLLSNMDMVRMTDINRRAMRNCQDEALLDGNPCSSSSIRNPSLPRPAHHLQIDAAATAPAPHRAQHLPDHQRGGGGIEEQR